ncbi:MAG: DUF2273 domain-containing protein, partial [Atopobiaceae bacterium]|nr:DUF2273 domain-containing protein [Atopobiaceae bacterium]
MSKDGHGLIEQLREQLEETFPGHGNTALFAIVGLIAGLLFIVFGFWRMLIITAFIVAGVAFGQYLDGDPKIVKLL